VDAIFIRRLGRCLIVLIFGASAIACSRTVTWEEEVPLNTGETLWVKRSIPWAMQGGTGNPFDIDLRPYLSKQTIQFTYNGKLYSYAGGADVRWIAISPAGVPVLLAESASLGWDVRNNYYCVIPQYVQLVPNSNGDHWTWPERIDSWVYKMPANLMGNVPRLDEPQASRYTAKDRDQRDALSRAQWPGGARIDPLHKTSCVTDPASILNKNKK
jgi:hypothetical protein